MATKYSPSTLISKLGDILKKTLLVVLAAALVAGAFVGPAEAGKKKPKKVTREVVFEYLCPCVGQYQLGGITGGTNLGGGVFAVGAESYITGVAEDTTGQAVGVKLMQDTDGDGFNNLLGTFCGETEEPIVINPALEMRVFVGDPEICVGAAAGGSITFTLSNLP